MYPGQNRMEQNTIVPTLKIGIYIYIYINQRFLNFGLQPPEDLRHSCRGTAAALSVVPAKIYNVCVH